MALTALLVWKTSTLPVLVTSRLANAHEDGEFFSFSFVFFIFVIIIKKKQLKAPARRLAD